MSDPASAPETPSVLPPASSFDRAAWILMGAALLSVLYFHLLPALLAGLLGYSLVHLGARQLAGKNLSHHRAKLVSAALIGLVLIGAALVVVLLLIAFLKGRLGNLPHLLERMAAIVETARVKMGWESWIPAADVLKEGFSRTLRGHARELEHAGGEAGRLVIHALAGMLIGALAAFDLRRPARPLSSALCERLARLENSFEKIVFAQLKISALNTAFTAIYLLAVLPAFGVELPLRKTLVLVTFVLGLIPVIGNLASNTAIVVISLGTSAPVAVASLVYLVVIHKLEYFLNARIVGREIRAAAWEILVAMLIFEAVFGLAGVVAAPILYAYVKRELMDRRMI